MKSIWIILWLALSLSILFSPSGRSIEIEENFEGWEDQEQQEEALEEKENDLEGNLLTSEESIQSPKRRRLYFLRASGVVDIYSMKKDGEYHEGISRNNLIKLSLQSGKYIGSVGIDPAKIFKKYSFKPKDEIDMEDVVGEATVGINNLNEQIIAVVIGKQRMPFGQREMHLQPHLFWDNEIEYVRRIFRVIGGKIHLSNLPVFNGIVDDMEFSVFESSENDFDIDGGPGGSLRLTKWIETDEYTYSLNVSYARKENSHLSGPILELINRSGSIFGQINLGQIDRSHFLTPRWGELTDDEERVSVGFKMESAYSDDFALWGDITYFDNNPLFARISPDSDFALTMGSVYQFKENYYISGEYTNVEDFKKTYAIGLWNKRFQNKNIQGLFIGGEYRNEDYDNGMENNILSLTLRLRLLRSKKL